MQAKEGLSRNTNTTKSFSNRNSLRTEKKKKKNPATTNRYKIKSQKYTE